MKRGLIALFIVAVLMLNVVGVYAVPSLGQDADNDIVLPNPSVEKEISSTPPLSPAPELNSASLLPSHEVDDLKTRINSWYTIALMPILSIGERVYTTIAMSVRG